MKTLRFIRDMSLAALGGVLLALFLAGYSVYSQDAVPSNISKPAPPQLLISGGTWNKPWMEIDRADVKAAEQRGFDPSYTYIICDYKPMVKKLKDGRWAIQFTSEIAEDLP